MSVRKLKPITPGQRFKVVNGFDAITADKPEKSLLAPSYAIEVVGIKEGIELLISNGISRTLLQK
jgi:ribosomal protein L2